MAPRSVNPMAVSVKTSAIRGRFVVVLVWSEMSAKYMDPDGF